MYCEIIVFGIIKSGLQWTLSQCLKLDQTIFFVGEGVGVEEDKNKRAILSKNHIFRAILASLFFSWQVKTSIISMTTTQYKVYI